MPDYVSTQPRSSFLARPSGLGEEGNGQGDSADSPQGQGNDNGTQRRRSAPASNTSADFTGNPVPSQFKLPADLLQSLKLISIQEGRSMSSIVFDCLTTDRTVNKAWVATRRS